MKFPIKTNIDTCLCDIKLIKISPDNIKKSLTLIFTLVKIKIPNTITKIIIIFSLFINVNGKCSDMFCVVFPSFVFNKYVYGVPLIGVKNPVNTHIITIKISHLIFFSFLILSL